MGQLTFGGGEVEEPKSRAQITQPLSRVQFAVLNELHAKGSIRSVEAGVIVHRTREKGCVTGQHTASFQGGGIGCCAYAAADGNEAMKRLMERGLVERAVERGRWIAVARAGG